MNNPTDNTASTPAAGGRFVGFKHRVTRSVERRAARRLDALFCDRCGAALTGDRCDTCAQRDRHSAGLECGLDTYGRSPLWATLNRADDRDGEGWNPTDDNTGDGEPEGWPW